MIWLLKYWKLLAVALLLAGVWVHGNRTGARGVQAEWDAARAADLTEKARLDAITAAKDAAQAQATRDMEADYAARLQAADAGRDAFAERLRVAQARVRRCELSAASADPGRAEGIATGGNGGPGGPDLESAQRLRDAGVKLQETVKLCVAWANSVGR